MKQYQNGGRQNRSTIDNIFIIRAMIDYYRYIQQDLYIVIADAEKCFDKLWLEDACCELHKCGIEASEVELIKK